MADHIFLGFFRSRKHRAQVGISNEAWHADNHLFAAKSRPKAICLSARAVILFMAVAADSVDSLELM